MSDPTFEPGSLHTATVGFTNTKDVALDYTIELCLIDINGAKQATSTVNLSLNPGESKDVVFSITMPVIPGDYVAWIEVYVDGVLNTRGASSDIVTIQPAYAPFEYSNIETYGFLDEYHETTGNMWWRLIFNCMIRNPNSFAVTNTVDLYGYRTDKTAEEATIFSRDEITIAAGETIEYSFISSWSPQYYLPYKLWIEDSGGGKSDEYVCDLTVFDKFVLSDHLTAYADGPEPGTYYYELEVTITNLGRDPATHRVDYAHPRGSGYFNATVNPGRTFTQTIDGIVAAPGEVMSIVGDWVENNELSVSFMAPPPFSYSGINCSCPKESGSDWHYFIVSVTVTNVSSNRASAYVSLRRYYADDPTDIDRADRKSITLDPGESVEYEYNSLGEARLTSGETVHFYYDDTKGGRSDECTCRT